jgi:cytochrome c oxidase subunit 2
MPFRSQFSWLFAQNTTIAWVVFGLVIAGMAVSVLLSWRKRRRGEGPARRAAANRLEAGYVLGLFGMAIFLVVSSFVANARDFPDPPKPAARIQVLGYQWCWQFHYAGYPVTMTGECQAGRLPVLVVPAGEPVVLDVTSSDVIHAFWVSYLRFKTYAYPGHTNTFTVTVPKPGRWIGRCAQLCGLYHFNMDFWLQAVPPATFDRFLRSGGSLAGAGAS